MIYTSYFANLKKIPDTITLIAICGKVTQFYTGLTYKKLAPKYSFFVVWKQTHDNDYYIQQFQNLVLDKLNADDVVAELKSLSKTKDFVLVCYEKPTDFCHRHLVAKWLRENGYDCDEWNNRFSKD